MAVIHDWMKRYPDNSCRVSDNTLRDCETDREFYDRISDISMFMRGICQQCPQRALWLTMHAVSYFIPPGADTVLASARAVALDDKTTPHLLLLQLTTLSGHLEGNDLIRDIILRLINWRLGTFQELEGVIICFKVRDYIKQKHPNDAELQVVTLLKTRLPFDEWLKGVKEEAYVEKPYTGFPKYLPIGEDAFVAQQNAARGAEQPGTYR
jgi:hypothetical protein